MDNSSYNSLTDKLIQSGIILSNENKGIENLFGIEPDEDMSHSPFIETPINKEVVPSKEQKNQKRINQYDLELIKRDSKEKETDIASFKIIKRFLNFKHNMAQKGSVNNWEKFLFTFFPRLYKAKLVKDAMVKLRELNIDTSTLLDKTIPYGESEDRYENLIKYLSYANELQTKLKKKM